MLKKLYYIGGEKIIKTLEVMFMFKNFTMCLLAAAAVLGGNCTKVSEIYLPGRHTSAYYSDMRYYEKDYSGSRESQNDYKTIRECIDVCAGFNICDISYPDDIAGIEKEIPYNYNSAKELSAKVLYSVLYKDWEITRYEADPVKAVIELCKDGVLCRIVIYEDRLKVYQKMPF